MTPMDPTWLVAAGIKPGTFDTGGVYVARLLYNFIKKTLIKLIKFSKI